MPFITFVILSLEERALHMLWEGWLTAQREAVKPCTWGMFRKSPLEQWKTCRASANINV